jgi:hypothetical protein
MNAQPGAGYGLRAGVALDLETAARAFPFGRYAIPLAALLVGLGIGWLRPGYTSVYGESLPVIVVLVAIGSFGRPVGALVTLAYGVADVAHFLLVLESTTGAQLTPYTFVGRLVLVAVLWLAVVVVPSFARRIESIGEDRLGDTPAGRIGGAVIGAVVVAGGIYLWSNVMPYLQRAAFKYSPPPFTIQPQQHPEMLAVACAVAFLAVAVVVRRRIVSEAELGPLVGGLPQRGLLGLVVRVVGYAVVIVLVSGILSGPRDALILVIGFTAGELVAWLLARSGAARIARGLPSTLMATGGLVATVVVALVVGGLANAVWPTGLADSPFFPIILATACAYPLARGALALAARGSSRMRGVPIPVAMVGVLAVVACVVLLFPMTALADNCSNLGDCGFSQRFLLVIGGFAAFFGAGAAAASSPPGGGGGDSGGGGGGSGPKSQPKPKQPPTPPPNDEY